MSFKRIDGRGPEDIRDIKMEINVIPKADGSALVKLGKTIVIAAVYGPRCLFPRHLQEQACTVRCRYVMAPFSTEERKTPGKSRREVEISKVIKNALESIIFLEEFPRAVIDAYVEVLQADGSTRCVSLNALSLALASAGIRMKDLIAACSVGKVEGNLIVDLNQYEDNNCEADVPLAYAPNLDELILLQMDGRLSLSEFKTLLKMGKEACMKIYEKQREVLERL